MTDPLSFYLARRMPLHESSGPSTRSNLGIAVTAIALSVVVMIVSVAVMGGFRREIRQKVMGFDSQLSVTRRITAAGQSPLLSPSDIAPVRRALPQGLTYSPTVRQPAILKSPVNFSGIVVKGVDNDYHWDFLRDNLVAGALPDYTADSTRYHILMSRLTAQALGIGPGDKIDTYFLADDIYKVRRLKVAGIFETNFEDYDANTAYGSLSMLQHLAGVADTCATVIEINGLGDDRAIDQAEAIANNTLMDEFVAGRTDGQFNVHNIHRTAEVFFSWLSLLDTNVAVILTIMAVLTLLTLVSALFILILRHVTTVGLLKALGAGDALIRATFIIMAAKILLRGLVAGNILALGLIALQYYTHAVPLNPEAYYLDHVPVYITPGAILAVNAAIAVVALTGLILPSAMVSTISPARAMRYE